MANNPVTIISPTSAPHDSFVGPEFTNAQATIKRSDRLCKCTSCGVEKDCTINKLYAHPVLKVLICDSCQRFYTCDEFTKDSEGYDEQCRWCGQGGNVLMCDSVGCFYSFCNHCIERNFSSETFAEILAKETWKCFCCDKSQLRRHVEECRRFINFNSLRPKSPQIMGSKIMNAAIPESLTRVNEQIDSLLEPLERSFVGLDSELSNAQSKEKLVNSNNTNKVTPITIFRKQDRYVVQRKSASCDEADSISNDSKTQSDPEYPMKLSKKNRLESKIGKIKIKIERRCPSETSLAEMNMMEDVNEGDNDKQLTTSLKMNGNIEGGVENVENIAEETNTTASKHDNLKTADNNDQTSSSLTITKPKVVRRNVGRRTTENRVGSGYEMENHNEQMSKSSGQDSDEFTEHKSIYSNPKLKKAGQLFDQYINLIKDLISEDCSLGISTSTSTHQSPSQYFRFRSANATLQHVKNASKQLRLVESTLRKTKTTLATYRDIVQSPKSTYARDDDNMLISSNRSIILTERSNELLDSTVGSESAQMNVSDIADDIKLQLNPQVIINKMNDEELARLFEMFGDATSGSDVSSLMLDSDSSKHHHGSESDDSEVSVDHSSNTIDIKNGSSGLDLSSDNFELDETEQFTDEMAKRAKKDNASKLLKQNVNKRKTKKVSKKDDSDSTMDNSLESDSILDSSDLDTDDISFVKQGQVHETDNNIAKNQLLQLLQEHSSAGEEDSDVEDFLSENKMEMNGAESNESAQKKNLSSEDTTKSNDEHTSKSDEAALGTVASGKNTKKHPLLAKRWDPVPSSGRSAVKRKNSEGLDENAPRSKKDRLAKLNGHGDDNSDSDLSTDSQEDWITKTMARKKRFRQAILDSDSDEPVKVKAGSEASHTSDDSDDFDAGLSWRKRQAPKPLPPLNAEPVESPKNQGRKNIRKVLGDDQTSQSTQEAKNEEMERRKRVEAQRDDGEADVIVIDDENRDDTNNNDSVKVLNMSLLLSKCPLIEVHPEIARHLKPHQCEGVQFIWENLIETVKFANSERGTGCILSHCMGLGKTLQTIAFLHAVLLSQHLPNIKTALVLCPFITVDNWIAEFAKWIPKGLRKFGQWPFYCSLDPAKTEEDRRSRILSWKMNGGVLIVGYNLFRSLLKGKNNDSSSWEIALLEPDILVCDEGHVLKNAGTLLAQLADRVKSKRRLILTGTPLQNNMIEYHCMVSLVKPRLLGSIKEFKNRFVNPIENGQHVDSTARDVRVMKKRAHILHELLAGCVQRKDYTFLKEHLAPKYEYTLKVRLSPLQIRLYEKYLSLKPTVKSQKASLFHDFNKFLLIVCHPRCLIMQNDINKKKTPDGDDDNEEDEEDDGPLSDDSTVMVSDDNGEKPVPVVPKPASLEDIHSLSNRKLRLFIKSKSGKPPETKSRKKLIGVATRYLDENFCKTVEFEESLKSKSVVELKALIKERGGSLRGCSEKSDLVNLMKSLLLNEATSNEEWFDKIIPSQQKLYFGNEHGGKIVLMLEILRGAATLGDKVVLFSQSLITLDYIELVLRAQAKEPSSKSGIPFTKWVRNKDYFRIDGSIPAKSRTSLISCFNNKNNQRGRLLLVSTRAGSMGVNLVGANRAIVFDASWNPTHDIQSIFRIYRFGQTKTCYIYRLVAQGAMEEKIYERQVVKRSLSYRVVDEQQIPRHFTAADISELYNFTPDQTKRKDSVPDCAPPRDALLASIINSTDLIVSFHEPDSLLDHQVSEELTEAERKAAWEEYNTDNPKIQQAPSSSFKTGMHAVSKNVLNSLCKHGENILGMIDQKLLGITEKPLDKMITELRMKKRSTTTEQVNLDVIQHKLNNHILRRRLNSMKETVFWHWNIAQEVKRFRLLANGPAHASPSGSSATGLSGSTVHHNPVGVGPRRPYSQTRFTHRSQPYQRVNNPNRPRHQQPPYPQARMPNGSLRFQSYQQSKPTHQQHFQWRNAR